jgi:group II intron reverse transcriptase/maturase
VNTRLDRITERARRRPAERYNNLFHHLDPELMAVAFEELHKDSAPGADGVTKAEYAEGLQARLHDLSGRLRRRAYHPQPSRRRMIPKGNGKLRPLGIPVLEDKLVQRSVVKVLERIYEEEFHSFSYGFRPGKSCHDALKALSWNIHRGRVGWVVEADIKGFFDQVDHSHLLAMLRHRVSDPSLLWLVEQFLRAGVLVDGKRLDSERGTPQGGVISPLLANIYLHHVLDEWFARAVEPQCRGAAHLVRYADDFVATFEQESDARRFFAALPGRLGKFGLEVAPEKTRMLRFGRFARRDAGRLGERSAVFDFLGFQHRCGTSRKGRYKVKWSTSPEKYRSKVRAMKDWIRAHRTLPLADIWRTVNAKLMGHYAYYSVSDNWPKLLAFRRTTMWVLYRWLNRRGQRRSFEPSTWVSYVEAMELALPVRVFANLNAVGP